MTAPTPEGWWIEAGLRAVASGAILHWSASACAAAVRRVRGRLPWDVEVLAVAPLVLLCALAPGVALGAIGQLRDVTWGIAVAMVAWAVREWGWRRAGVVPATTMPAAPGPPFVLALGGYVLGRGAYVLRNPPADVDSLYYHLPMVARWFETGALDVPVRAPYSASMAFPGCGEMLHLWLAWTTGRETLMPLAGVALTGLLALAMRRLMLRFGATPAIAGVCALAFTASPGVLQLTLGLRVDVMLAAAMAAGLWWALDFRTRPDPVAASAMLACAGFVTGAKSTGIVFAGVLAFIALAAPDLRGRARALLGRRALPAAALIGGFWFARNLFVWRNPLFPATLHIGPFELAGAIPHELLAGTSQVAIWRAGFAGNFTAANLWAFYGMGLVAIAAAPLALLAGGRREGPGEVRERALVVAIGALLLAATWLSPYSGANQPPHDGALRSLALDNLRYYLPAMLMLAAVGPGLLARLPGQRAIAALLGAGALFLLRRNLGQLLPGVVLAAALVIAGRWLARRGSGARAWPRAAATVAVALGVAALVVAVDARRQALADLVWDSHLRTFPNLDAAAVRRLVARADGRPIALVGVGQWWPYHRRDFSGRPVYVPVAMEWSRAAARYSGATDPRERADRATWLANLARSGAAFVVVGRWGGPEFATTIESRWCREDPTRFRFVARHGDVEAYEVLAGAGGGLVTRAGAGTTR